MPLEYVTINSSEWKEKAPETEQNIKSASAFLERLFLACGFVRILPPKGEEVLEERRYVRGDLSDPTTVGAPLDWWDWWDNGGYWFWRTRDLRGAVDSFRRKVLNQRDPAWWEREGYWHWRTRDLRRAVDSFRRKVLNQRDPE